TRSPTARSAPAWVTGGSRWRYRNAAASAGLVSYLAKKLDTKYNPPRIVPAQGQNAQRKLPIWIRFGIRFGHPPSGETRLDRGEDQRRAGRERTTCLCRGM